MLKETVRLIKHVLCLGIFFYNGHPVRQVDVVGTVVQTKERDTFYNCGGKENVFLSSSLHFHPFVLVTVRTERIPYLLIVYS